MKILKLTMLALCFILLNAATCCDDNNEDTLPPKTGRKKYFWVFGGWRRLGANWSGYFSFTHLVFP